MENKETVEERKLQESSISSQLIRTPDQRVRVFVSSSIEELARERGAARDGITQLHLTPVLFESGARPYPPRELYRAYLEQSDVFIGIYGQSYGRIAPGMKISGLEDEYNLAGQKPKLIYLKIPAQNRDPALQRLLDRVKTQGAASYQKFTTVEELRERIADDLAQLLTERFTALKKRSISQAVIPVPRTRLIGREKELAHIESLLSLNDVGPVTLTGPPGVGKTRLAVQVAEDSATRFEDGVAFVSLASIRDPNLVVPTLTRSLSLPQSGTEEIEDDLFEYLHSKKMLLILDNAEQVISIASLLARALQAAPQVKLLVTSRESLRVRGERIVPITPLAFPERSQTIDPQRVAEFPAVALFIERVRDVRPEFDITKENAAAIASISQRLDGLPLALELAAVALPLLSPSALLDRLEHGLPLPARGLRDLPERQQTMRDTIAWSYDLLEAGEKRLFTALSVFPGSFTLDAVQAVCLSTDKNSYSSEREDVLQNLARLLDKSLVITQSRSEGDPRFTMLETIREYASELRRVSQEDARLRQRHADFFLRFAEQAEPFMFTGDRDVWMERLDREEDNFRAALSSLSTDKNAVQPGLRMVRALGFYWSLRGTVREARRWTEEMLVQTDSTDRGVIRGRTLQGAGWLAWNEGDYATASNFAKEGLDILQKVGDKRESGLAQMLLGLLLIAERDSTAARASLERTSSLFKELGDESGQAFTLYNLGMADYFSGDRRAARGHYKDSLNLFEKLADTFGVTIVSSALETLALPEGEEETVRPLYEQSLRLLQASKDRGRLGMIIVSQGDIWLHKYKGEDHAISLYKQGLRLWRDMIESGQTLGIAKALAGLGELAAAKGEAEKAGRLLATADNMVSLDSNYRIEINRRVAEARSDLDPMSFTAGWTDGKSMTQEQAIEKALG